MIFIGVKGIVLNNGGWFAVQSLYVSGFFIITLLLLIENNLKRRFLTVLVIIISFAGTYTFLEFRNYNGYIQITSQQLDLSRYIDKYTPEDSIIIEPIENAPSIASHLSGRSSLITIYMTFISYVASSNVIDERVVATKNIYDRDYKGDKGEIVQKYNINYIIIVDSQKEHFEHLALGVKVFENNKYSLIRVSNEM